MKHFFIYLVVMLFFFSCEKNNDSNNKPVNDDATKFLLFSATDNNNYTNLFCYDSLNKLSWGRKFLYNSGAPICLYSSGVVYFPVWVTVDTTVLYAINCSNGQDVYQTKIPGHIFDLGGLDGSCIREDTIYCYINGSTSGNLTAINAKNGSIIWKFPITSNTPIEYLNLDGNYLYYTMILQNNNYSVLLTCFDLSTKKVKWTAPIGYNFANSNSRITIAGNNLYISDAQGKLYSFDKTSGKNIWALNNYIFNQPYFGNDLVYSSINYSTNQFTTSNTIFALNPENGNSVWNIKTSDLNSEILFLKDKQIYLTGFTDTAFISSYNALNGNKNWSNFYFNNSFVPTSLVALGRNLYATDVLFSKKILIFDTDTGIKKDSIFLNNTSSISTLELIDLYDNVIYSNN